MVAGKYTEIEKGRLTKVQSDRKPREMKGRTKLVLSVHEEIQNQ